jgi:CHASE2 domain-containing sensor protein
VLYTVAGWFNAVVPSHRADLIHWGFPGGANLVIGVAEWLAVAALWARFTRAPGYGALVIITAGAGATLAVVGEWSRFAPPVTFAAVLTAAIIMERKAQRQSDKQKLWHD